MIESFRNDRSEIVSDTKYLESYTSSDVAQIDRRHSGGQVSHRSGAGINILYLQGNSTVY